jgi:hypothetical protein
MELTLKVPGKVANTDDTTSWDRGDIDITFDTEYVELTYWANRSTQGARIPIAEFLAIAELVKAQTR